MNNFKKPITISSVIDEMRKYIDTDPEESFCVYGKGLPDSKSVNLDSICYLDEYSDFDEDDNEVLPEFVTENGLIMWFTDEIIHQVVINSLHQKASADNEEILKGIFYYYRNDTFMDLKS